jgi:hypothetical protein
MGSRLERLRGLEEAETPLKLNQIENLQEQAILLNERRSKYLTEIYSLKSDLRMLGNVAKLVRDTTFPITMRRKFYPDSEEDEQLHLLKLRNCVEKVGAASRMMWDMTLLMARVSAQK